MSERNTPRVILRVPRRGRFEDAEVLVLEMGLAGSKFEHRLRLPVDRQGIFSCGPLTTAAVVRYSELLPAASEGSVYQSGIEFTRLTETDEKLLLDLLVHEAKEQVTEWEANLAGDESAALERRPVRRSAASVRFVHLTLGPGGWKRSASSDPNQPANGLAVLRGTPEEEIAMLQNTFESADPAARELLRKMATVAILEHLSGPE